jgi:serine/threonine protein kinase
VPGRERRSSGGLLHLRPRLHRDHPSGALVGSRYEIRERLGSGGMGTVYKAHDRVLDETVALKILRREIAGSPEMARRFRSEIKLARRVRHPNVCGIHEYGEEGDLRYISMELIEGTDLKQIVQGQGALPRRRTRSRSSSPKGYAPSTTPASSTAISRPPM